MADPVKTVSSPPIIDLHCDLLAFLGSSGAHSSDDPASRCSVPQLESGGVRVQVMAILAAVGPMSVVTGERQVACFVSLRNRLAQANSRLRVVAAIESAASLGSDSNPLAEVLARLHRFHRETGGLIGVSLTWNEENRFGGGNASSAGLKDDGRRLLTELATLNIALDLAHASDPLADDCLAFIDRERLPLAVFASHSNFRAVFDHPRNLPDELAREIVRRGGLIGLNAIRRFLGGTDSSALARHLAHGLHLGAAASLALGADFCADWDVPPEKGVAVPRNDRYFPFWSDASSYPSALSEIERIAGISTDTLAALAFGNAATWFERRGRPDLASAARPTSPSSVA